MIDLRRNQGGDFTRFRQVLLPIIKARAAINRKGGLFVITGPGTFSAATVNALDLRTRRMRFWRAPDRNEADPLRRTRRVPAAQLGFSNLIFDAYHRFGAELILRSSRIGNRADLGEFRAGRDPVMEWILGSS